MKDQPSPSQVSALTGTENIAHKTIEAFLWRTVTQVTLIAANVITARFLGPTAKGEFSYAALVAGVGVGIGAGETSAIAWQFGKNQEHGRSVHRAMLDVLLWIVAPAAFILAAIGVLFSSQRALIAAGFALPLTMYLQFVQGFFLTRSNVRAVNVQYLIAAIVAVFLIGLGVAFLHLGITAVLVFWVLSFVPASVCAALQLRPYINSGRGDPGKNLFREQIRFASKSALVTLVWFMNYRIDMFIILAFLGLRAFGIYTVGVGVGEIILQLSRPLAMTAFGRMAVEPQDRAAAFTAKVCRHTLALLLVLAIPVYVFGPWAIRFVYGDLFAPAGPVVRFILPGVIAYSIIPVLTNYITIQLGKPIVVLMFQLIGTILCSVITVAIIHQTGIVAGAIATSIAYCASTAAAGIYFLRSARLAPTELLFRKDDLRAFRALMQR